MKYYLLFLWQTFSIHDFHFHKLRTGKTYATTTAETKETGNLLKDFEKNFKKFLIFFLNFSLL